MKKTLLNMFMMTAFCAVFGCMTVFAQGIMVGGYKTVPVDNARVKAAANYAVATKAKEMKEKLTLQSIEKAETQVVQGTNYRLCMVLYVPSSEPETDGVMLYIKSVIYQDLKGVYKISKWEDDDDACGVEQ